MKLIVGLGNPGKDYNNTRHNIGFEFLDNYIKYLNISDNWSNKFNGLYISTNINGEKVIFLKPQSYMNLSGIVVRKFVDYFNIDIENILVISDDLDLLIGNFKLRPNGSSGGHNGLKDIEKCLNTNQYKRLKIGISKDKNVECKDYVLGKFDAETLKVYKNLFNDINMVIDDFFKIPFSDLMNKYNRKNR